MDIVRCPVCASEKVVRGIAAQGGPGRTLFLLPRVDPLSGLPLGARMQGCLACGHLWSSFDPDRFRAHVAEQGCELDRQYLDEVERGPNRDLPDTELGRGIGAHIAELDALARGHATALIRRYRDLRDVTWDDAIREAARWPRLTREGPCLTTPPG